MNNFSEHFVSVAPFQIVTTDEADEYILGDPDDEYDPLASPKEEKKDFDNLALIKSDDNENDKTIKNYLQSELEDKDGLINVQAIVNKEEPGWVEDDALESELETFSQSDSQNNTLFVKEDRKQNILVTNLVSLHNLENKNVAVDVKEEKDAEDHTETVIIDDESNYTNNRIKQEIVLIVSDSDEDIPPSVPSVNAASSRSSTQVPYNAVAPSMRNTSLPLNDTKSALPSKSAPLVDLASTEPRSSPANIHQKTNAVAKAPCSLVLDIAEEAEEDVSDDDDYDRDECLSPAWSENRISPQPSSSSLDNNPSSPPSTLQATKDPQLMECTESLTGPNTRMSKTDDIRISQPVQTGAVDNLVFDDLNANGQVFKPSSTVSTRNNLNVSSKDLCEKINVKPSNDVAPNNGAFFKRTHAPVCVRYDSCIKESEQAGDPKSERLQTRSMNSTSLSASQSAECNGDNQTGSNILSSKITSGAFIQEEQLLHPTNRNCKSPAHKVSDVNDRPRSDVNKSIQEETEIIHNKGFTKDSSCDKVQSSAAEKTVMKISCPLCDESSSTNQDIQEHILKHLDETLLICPICCSQSTNIENLKQHVLKAHVKDWCSKCNGSVMNLCQHRIVDHAVNPIKCEMCLKQLKSSEDLRGHICSSQSTNSNNYPFWCYFCNADLKSENNLYHHTLRNHMPSTPSEDTNKALSSSLNDSLEKSSPKESIVRKVTCPFCYESYPLKLEIRKHLYIHFDKDLAVCTICCRQYKDKAFLIRHIFKVHMKVKDQCPLCQKEVTNVPLHMKYVHATGEPTEFCKHCFVQFNSRQRLTNHIYKVHSSRNVVTMTCNDCNAEFKNRRTLTEHIFSRHMPPQFKCTECLKMFQSVYSLRKHMGRTGHNSSGKIRKNFVCEKCGKSFITLSAQNSHMLIHLEEKQFVCEDCGKKFTTSSNLRQHRRIHSDLRPFSCDMCDKSFRIINHLKQHMVVHASTSRKRKRNRKDSSDSDKSV